MKYRILIVDDDELNLESLGEDLADQGYKVEVARDGREAWEMIKANKSEHYDLVMLDRMMPEMSGEELLDKIRDSEEFAKLPVIMQTARDETKEVLDCYESGCNWYLSKPYGTKFMLEIVKKVILKSKISKN
jgi:two-component system sensor histidine kinase ChiS